MSRIGHLDEIGAGIGNKAVTDVLYVSPIGTGTDGKTIASAFTTIQDALDAASTDGDDLTLIMISPNETYYDINTTGDPTWTGNYILKGSHRNWAKIKNDHVSATSVMKFTGKVALRDLNINLGTSNNGVILTHSGIRVYDCQFVGEDLTTSATALHLDHASTGKHAKVIDIDYFGKDGTLMTALLIDEFCCSQFENIRIHDCLTGIQIVGSNSIENQFNNIHIGNCAIGIDVDAGIHNHFDNILLHNNTLNIDDETGDCIFQIIVGSIPITSYPEDLTGISVTASNEAETYGGDVELRSAAAATKPFRIVGYVFEPGVTQKHLIRFSADSGSTFFNYIHINSKRNQATAASSDSEYIFNKGTRISCSLQAESGGADTVNVWLKIQEI